MENSSRTYQQTLVWHRLCEGLKSIEQANEHLEQRASKLIGGSTGTIAAIAGINMLPKSVVDVGLGESIILLLLCLTVLVMFWYASRLWGPQPLAVTSTHDTDVLYDEYIAKSEDVAFNNALIDTAKAFEHAKWVNEIKGKEIRHMFIVLQAQVFLLGVGVVIKAFF